MQKTLAFDVYGTLIDTSGVLDTLQNMIFDKADMFMKSWRQKQLEYSFRRGLMRQHCDFSICTRDALNYCCESLDVSLSDKQKETLLDSYTILPDFPDVKQCLAECRDAGHRIYAFSNGSADAVKQLLDHSDIYSFFDGIVSTEDVHTFKPSPDAYQYFIKNTQSVIPETWLISGNSFDVMGARACGWNAAWVQRSPDKPYDPWSEFMPTATIESLASLPGVLTDS
ncbi:haloacid dehalogenase type II [Rhodohalobacter sp. 8-1]|uniref:haloacid dehalogenase type II n=1 Tax=Rhodohalobacter sp. 8-1 TaxID=3131972 RepID=UPI0030ED99B8